MQLFYLAGGIGVILVLTGLGRIVANLRFLSRSTATEGKFVRWEITEPGTVGGPNSTKGNRSYRPIVSFRAADGSQHQLTGSAYRLARHAPDGRSMSLPVRYDAANPTDARLVTFTDFWLFPLGVLVVGVVSLVFAVRS